MLIFNFRMQRCSHSHPRIVAGALESLSALAHALLEIGVSSPFLVCSRLSSFTTRSMSRPVDTPSAHTALARVFADISADSSWGPYRFRRDPTLHWPDRDRCYWVSIAAVTKHRNSLKHILFYSTGKVAQGCLDLLSKLPIQTVSVEDLPRLVKDPGE